MARPVIDTTKAFVATKRNESLFDWKTKKLFFFSQVLIFFFSFLILNSTILYFGDAINV